MLDISSFSDYHTPVRQGTSFQRMGRNTKLPASYIPQTQAAISSSGHPATQGHLMPRPTVQASPFSDANVSIFSDIDKYYVGNQPQQQQQQQQQIIKYTHYPHQTATATNLAYEHSQLPQQQVPHSLLSHHQPGSVSSPVGNLTHGFKNMRVTSVPVSRADVMTPVSRAYGLVYSHPISGFTSGVSRPVTNISHSGYSANITDSQQQHQQMLHSHPAPSSQEDQHSPHGPLSIIREGKN